MARRKLTFNKIWKRHVQIYTNIFCQALQKLSQKEALSGDEDKLSETLCPILNEICFTYYQNTERKVEIPVPDWEKPVQPVKEDELKGGKIRKRPDFVCKKINPYAVSPEDYEIPFHVECKRLGAPTSKSWVLNENYVKNGIKRFDCITHEYGKRAYNGLMIGYIISTTPEDIQNDVNKFQNEYLQLNPAISLNCINDSIFLATQNLIRKKVLPSQFTLSHIWIDLRKCYSTKTASLLGSR